MSNKPTPRIQQPPQRPAGPQQRQSSGPGQSQPSRPRRMGEGSYEAAEDYQNSIKSYLKKADVKADAKAASPKSSAEVEELQQAEDKGLSHSKSRGD